MAHSPMSSPSRAARRDSPRPSIDQPSAPAPFLHNLTQRLRKGSNSSHAADPPPLSDPVAKTEASRLARRRVMALVKDDWEYPCAHSDEASGLADREPMSYRRREEGHSDLEADEIFARRVAKTDPYKFDTPDSVGKEVAERKRKRRRLLEDELRWNEGLRTWTLRRDAWTGAVRQVARGDRSNSSASKDSSRKLRLPRPGSGTHDRRVSQSTDLSSSLPTSPTSPTPESGSVDSTDSAAPRAPEAEPWLPIFPPMLADDHIRERIKPAAYATIYSKVVVQSMAPNVPIPLSHMISALVEGWKAEGNWPPQPTGAQDLRQRHRSSTFARWRKEPRHEALAAEPAVLNDDGVSRVRRSLGMMRKVLGGSPDDELERLGIEFRNQDLEETQAPVQPNNGPPDA